MDVVRYGKETSRTILNVSPANSQRLDPLEIQNQGRDTPDINQKPLVLITLPRSGTHWLRQMLEALPGVRLPSNPSRRLHLDPIALREVIEAEPPATLICDHLFFSVCAQTLYDCGIQPILLFRDPRDVLVSQMYSVYKDTDLDVHSPSIWKSLLDAMVNGKRYNLPDRGPHMFRSMRWGFLNQAVFWLDFPDVFVVKYESLISDTVGEINKIISHLELNVTSNTVEEIVNSLNFDKLSNGRSPGEEDPKNHYRKGVVGDWKEKLDKNDIILVEEAIGDLIVRMGYNLASESSSAHEPGERASAPIRHSSMTRPTWPSATNRLPR